MPEQQQPPPRGFIAEWAVTFILLLFGTTTLAQAFVIPSGSMEDTLLVGDHLLVDKLAYAPHDSATAHLLPYDHVKRGDIIVFRWPIDITENYVKRVIGLPGDRIHLLNRQVFLNGHPLNEPYVAYTRPPSDYADNFPNGPGGFGIYPRAEKMLAEDVKTAILWCPPAIFSRWGITAIIRRTAVTGGWCRAKILSASRW